MQFEEGEIVKLKSGGPRMTIEALITDTNSVICSWFDGTDRKQETFRAAALEKYVAQPRPVGLTRSYRAY